MAARKTSTKAPARALHAEAMRVAWQRYAAIASASPDRAPLIALRKAARELDKALLPFLGSSDDAAQLLNAMRNLQTPAPLATYRAMLDGLVEPLQLLQAAVDGIVGDGRGIKPKRASHVWVLVAASAWQEVTGENPTDAETGLFLLTLLDFKKPGVPPVTRATVRDALPVWRRELRVSHAKSGAKT
jgi:hypothetical protein